VLVHEPQRRRVDAVAQAAAIARTIVEDMSQMAVAVRRAYLGADHAMRIVVELLYVGGLDRLREAWPARAGVIFIRRREERLARHDVDVDAGLLVVEQRARPGHLRPALLGDAKLLRGKPGNDGRVLGELV